MASPLEKTSFNPFSAFQNLDFKKESILPLAKKIILSVIIPPALLSILVVSKIIVIGPLVLLGLATAGGILTVALLVVSVANSFLVKKDCTKS
jgi:hypothetical protein